MRYTLLTISCLASLVVYTYGQEYKCAFVSSSNCVLNHTLGPAKYMSKEKVRMEYDCRPKVPSCVETTRDCTSYILTFNSPTHPETTLLLTHLSKEENQSRTVDIGTQESYKTTFSASNEYIIEFRCQHNHVNEPLTVTIHNLEMNCQSECDGSNARAGLYVLIPIILVIIAVAIGLLIRRHKRIEAKKKFDRENPDYQSLKRNRTSRHYQFPSLWTKRNKRKESSASDQVYEVCGKVVGPQRAQDNGSNYDYDYAYPRSSVAAHKGFEDSAGYLKPKVEELDEDAYLKPSPSSEKRVGKIDVNNLDKKGYLKPSPSPRNSSANRSRGSNAAAESDDDSENDYVLPNDVGLANKDVKMNTFDKNKNRGSAGIKEKPVIPKKPILQGTTSNSSLKSVELSSPAVKKRPQPSPRSGKRESASTEQDYLSIVEPEIPKQPSIQK